MPVDVVSSLASTPLATLPALVGTSSVMLALAFTLVMGIVGLILGRFFGNDEGILESVVASRTQVTDEMRRHAKEVVACLEDGETSEVLFKLLRLLQFPNQVEELFAGAPLDTLLARVPDLANLSKEERPYGDQLLRLLSRIVALSDDAAGMRILGAMIKVMPRYRHAAPFLVEICKRNPDAWNDLQPSLEAAASHDPAIARYLRESAGGSEPFVRKATELYMTSMVSFRRVCEERATNRTAAGDATLQTTLAREFAFLKVAGTVSRRFVWLPAQAHRFHDLVSDEQLDLLLREAPSGPGEVHALLGQLTLTWAVHAVHENRVRRVLAALEDAAVTHPSAADALLEIFLGLKTEDAGQVRPEREKTRQRAYFALLSAAEQSFEVIKLLGSHGIPRDLYQGSADIY